MSPHEQARLLLRHGWEPLRREAAPPCPDTYTEPAPVEPVQLALEGVR